MTYGITDWGVWIPYYRLTGELVRGTFGSGGKSSRAYASFDEDAVTMAAEAVMRLREPADLLYFASVSAPYVEKQHAAIVASAAHWPHTVATADWNSSLRAGLSALQGALDAVAAKRVQCATVVASDKRPVAAGAAHELQFGDGAAALTVGANPVYAFRGGAAASVELMDAWRREGDRTVSEADAKYVEQESYAVLQRDVLAEALSRAGWRKEDLAAAYLWAPDSRIHGVIQTACGLKKEQAPGSEVFTSLGSLGTAMPFILLMADAPNRKPGDKVALCGHGSGAEVLLFEVTERISKSPADAYAQAVARKAVWPNYGAHLNARRLIAGENLDPFTAAPVWRREESSLLRRCAAVCEKCGEAHYPPQPLCRKCRNDRFAARRLQDTGTIVTFTADHLYPSPLSPTYMISADIDGGGRFYGQLTDTHGHAPAIGDRVRFTFRRIHEGGNFVNYFWKLTRPPKTPTPMSNDK